MHASCKTPFVYMVVFCESIQLIAKFDVIYDKENCVWVQNTDEMKLLHAIASMICTLHLSFSQLF